MLPAKRVVLVQDRVGESNDMFDFLGDGFMV